MKKQLVAVGLLVVAGMAGADLLACGDKFLVVSRGTRFQRATAHRTATILVYANPASELPKALANLAIDKTLRKAGYRPTIVVSKDEFDKALADGEWDLVLADVADIQPTDNRFRGETSPAVLPVVYNATSAQLKQVKHQFQCILKSPTKSQPFLDAVDEALALKPKSQAKSAGKTTG